MPSFSAVSAASCWQPGRIGPAEIEEPLAKSGERRAPGRAVGEELEVIGDEHEIPHPEAFVDPAGGIGDQRFFTCSRCITRT